MERTKQHEGLKLCCYDDATGLPIGPGSVVKGYPTIGYGRLLCAPGGITAGEANGLFVNSWNAATNGAATLPAYAKLDPIRQGVLIEMVFQLGLGHVKEFTRALAAMEAGNFKAAAIEMLASAWAKETPARAEELAQIMERGA